MAVEFTLEQQEAFNSTLAEKQKQWSRKYEGYSSPDDVAGMKKEYEKQIADLTAALDGANKKASKYDSDIADRDKRIKDYETASVKARIAHEEGLGYEGIQWLKGEDEDSIRESAVALKNYKGVSKVYPDVSTEPNVSKDSTKESIKKLAHSLGGNN